MGCCNDTKQFVAVCKLILIELSRLPPKHVPCVETGDKPLFTSNRTENRDRRLSTKIKIKLFVIDGVQLHHFQIALNLS